MCEIQAVMCKIAPGAQAGSDSSPLQTKEQELSVWGACLKFQLRSHLAPRARDSTQKDFLGGSSHGT